MSGNENSGRKTARVEHAKNEAIRKAWLKVNDELDSKGVERVALPLVLKDMVAKVGNPDGSNIVIPIYGAKSIQGHESDKTDIQPNKEDTSN